MQTKTDSIVYVYLYVDGISTWNDGHYSKLKLPMAAKNYRIYLSRKANLYKKYYQNVRIAKKNKKFSSSAAHKDNFTKRRRILDWYAVHRPENM